MRKSDDKDEDREQTLMALAGKARELAYRDALLAAVKLINLHTQREFLEKNDWARDERFEAAATIVKHRKLIADAACTAAYNLALENAAFDEALFPWLRDKSESESVKPEVGELPIRPCPVAEPEEEEEPESLSAPTPIRPARRRKTA